MYITNKNNQAAIREIKMQNTLPNGNSRNFHPAKIRDYVVGRLTVLYTRSPAHSLCGSN